MTTLGLSADELLTTTRSVRKRLDFDRSVDPALIEECLEFAREDECVEVTPEVVRIRKVELDATQRARNLSRSKKQ